MIYATNRTARRELAFFVAFVLIVALATLWACGPPVAPAQQGATPPPPPEGYSYRYEIQTEPLPDWVVVIQEALSLRPSTLDDFVTAGIQQASADYAAASTDAEAATAQLTLRGYHIIAIEFDSLTSRPNVLSESVGRLILQRIEVGAFGIFTPAEREAIAQSAADYARQVIEEEAALRAARWQALATTPVDVPSDLGSPVPLE